MHPTKRTALTRIPVTLLALGVMLLANASAQTVSAPGKAGAASTTYPSTPQLAPPAILNRGELVMAINASTPPSMYLDAKGEIVGYRAEMGREIARRLGLKPVFVNVKFPAQIPGLTGGRWDVSVSGAFVTPDRAKVVAMIPTEMQGVSISSATGNPKGINEEKDLAGLRVAVEHGAYEWRAITEISKKLVAQGLKPIDIRTFEGASVGYQALKAGQVDAVAANDPIARYYQDESQNAFQQRLRGLAPSPQSVAVKGGNDVLAQAMVKALDSMKADGWYDRLVARWGFGPIKGNTFEVIYKP